MHIFYLPYSRKDGIEAARQLRDQLIAAGFSVWQDLIAMESDRDWWSQITTTLKSNTLQHFVLVVTPGALESKVVRDEIRLARQEGKAVSLVKMPQVDFELGKVPRWFRHVYDLGIQEQKTAFLEKLKKDSTQHRVPMMAPEPPGDFSSALKISRH